MIQHSSNHNVLSICLFSREFPAETAWGGIGTYTYYLAHGLAVKGHRIHVITETLDKERTYQDGTVTVHRILNEPVFLNRDGNKEFTNRLEYSRRLYSKFLELHKEYKFDLVEGPNFAAEAYCLAFKKPVPLVTRIHSSFNGIINTWDWDRTLDHDLSCFMEDSVILKSDLVVFSTEGNKQFIFDNMGIRPENVRVIPLGIPLPSGQPAGEEYKKNEVLFVGRIEKRKGVDALVRSIPLVLEHVPEASFRFVGRDTFPHDGECQFSGQAQDSYTKKLLESLPEGCRSKVEFTGYVTNEVLQQCYQQCDVFVAPSLYESFGLIYLEAMAYGKPVIGCRVGGVPEIISDGDTGLLIELNDHEQCAHAIITLLQDREKRDAIGERARHHVAEHFSLERMITGVEHAYRQLLEKP
jgi:glycosyltransferase involved in cell wall biosynthesis